MSSAGSAVARWITPFLAVAAVAGMGLAGDPAQVGPAPAVRLAADEVNPLAGVPFYLLVDRFTDPLSVSLYSEPADKGYATITTVDVGEKLHLPDPFGITLDTSALPLPR